MKSVYNIVKNNQHEILKTLLETGNVDINEITEVGHGYNILELSIAKNAWECFLLILEKGADINMLVKEWSGYIKHFPLEVAIVEKIKNNNDKYYNRLMECENLIPHLGLIPCCQTKNQEDFFTFRELLNHPNFEKGFETLGYEYIYYFSDIAKNYLVKLGKGEFLEALLAKNLYIILEEVLLEAIELNKIEIIKVLMDHGVNLNKQVERDSHYMEYYPLVTASLRGNHKLIKLFLDKGANPNVSSMVYGYGGSKKEDLSPLMICSFRKGLEHDNNGNCYNINSFQKCAELLLKAGADPNFVSNYGRNALGYAIGMCLPKMITILLKYGAKPDLETDVFYLTMAKKHEWSESYYKNKDDLLETMQTLVKNKFNIFGKETNSHKRHVLGYEQFNDLNGASLLLYFLIYGEKQYDVLIEFLLTELKKKDVAFQKRYLEIECFKEKENDSKSNAMDLSPTIKSYYDALS